MHNKPQLTERQMSDDLRRTKNPDQILTTRQVSDEFGIAAGTLRYMRSRGDGPTSFNLGPKKVVYRRGSVEEWIAHQEETTSRGGVSA